MTPLISIVTGTHNRLSHLQQMVASARASIGAGLAYEIIVVDAGSTDGTPEWCARQPDLRLIQQGARLGAIRAFDAGAEAAQGDYVLLANDDIRFLDDAILRAVGHLETHPACGAVAFADDRPAPGYPGGVYKTQTIGAFADADMTHAISVIYPQVGLIRRWLGDLAGWWGSRDPRFQPSHTYGGDARLGAEIWQAGYTVDAVEGANVQDLVAPDDLREHNYAVERDIGSAYYRAYPQGPNVQRAPVVPNPQTERLRILYLPLYEPHFGHYKSGLRAALANVGLVVEWDYLNERGNFAALMQVWQPHLVLTQFHSAEGVGADLEAARKYAPGAVVVNWNGDVWEPSLVSPDVMAMLQHVDLQLVVNADVLADYEAAGIPAAYWQIGWEPVDERALPDANPHDVVFLANAYSEDRRKLGRALRKLPCNVGLYGRGWKDANGECLYDFPKGRALYQRATLALSDNQYTGKAFVSNRLFEALVSGVCVLQQRVPGLEELTGMIAGVHYIEWTTLHDLENKIAYYLEHPDEAAAVGAVGRAYALEAHSFDARVRELFERLLPMAAERKRDAVPV